MKFYEGFTPSGLPCGVRRRRSAMGLLIRYYLLKSKKKFDIFPISTTKKNQIPPEAGFLAFVAL